MARIDSSVARAIAGHVISTTASLSSGRAVVAMRLDNGFDDDVYMTPRSARALARALIEFSRRAESINRKGR